MDELQAGMGSTEIARCDAERWIAKAQRACAPLLELPGAPAAAAGVVSVRAPSVAAGPFGGFMLTWPEFGVDEPVINHLPDGAFFLALLRRAYAPVLAARPYLRFVLQDRSRLELAVTNDVLQVQLVTGESPYSMIRHHALMLFEATLWLDVESRAAWFELTTAVADHLMSDRSASPSMSELADIEAAGFEGMQRLAPDSWGDAAAELLAAPDLQPIVTYQLWATAAIGALARSLAARSGPEPAWHEHELAAYQDPDYLSDTIAACL